MRLVEFKGMEVFAKEIQEARIEREDRIERELLKEREERKEARKNKIASIKQLLLTEVITVLLFIAIMYFAISNLKVEDLLLLWVAAPLYLTCCHIYIYDTVKKIRKQ